MEEATQYVQQQEKLVSMNGLGCLVQALADTKIMIDLRNEATVTGIAKEIDGYMNILLENVIYESNDGNCYKYDTMYVKNRNIRYIHLPKNLSVRETILKFLRKECRKTVVQKTAMHSFKMKKLMKNQQETRAAVERLKQCKLKDASKT